MTAGGEDGIEEDGRSPHVSRMERLGEVVDRIVAVDREAAVVAARRAVLVEEARLLSEADAVASRVEAEAAGKCPRSESGWTPEVTAWRELVSELACALRLPERSTEALIANSRALCSDLPSTLAALGSGEISYRHAEKLIDHAGSLPEAARASFESAALPHARELTVAKFDKRARVLRERVHPESIAARTRAARQLRNVFVDPARDGMAYLTAYLPAPVAVAGFNRIDEIAAGLQKQESETRTIAQLRADVFADLATDGITDPITLRMPRVTYTYREIPQLAYAHQMELERMGVNASYEELHAGLESDLNNYLAEQDRVHASVDGIGHGVTSRTTITVPALTLLERSDEPATLEGYGPIDADTARELAAGAPSWNRILTHPETGAVLSVGRDSYTVPADMRRHLEHRDQTCRHPGCNRRVEACELDHSEDWYYDGDTSAGNLAHLCKAHHHLKHHTGWRYHHVDDQGTLAFTSPTGRSYITRPENAIGIVPPDDPPRTMRPGTVRFE